MKSPSHDSHGTRRTFWAGVFLCAWIVQALVPSPVEAAPTLIFLSPTADATIGGTERFKVQVYAGGGLAATDPISWSVDGGASSTTVSLNGNYDCGTGCGVYEIDLDTTALLNGAHSIVVEAIDADSHTATKSLSFSVSNSGSVATGDGYLLRRTHSSQLCLDCHALKTHSSQHTSSKYGDLGFECLTCHTAHKTRNIYLVRESIATPNDGDQPVTFRNTTGKADDSYATVTSPGNGICEVCHTKTQNSDGTARFRNTGESDGGKHYTSRCTDCHPHSKGFAAGESEGGATCSGCHGDIWDGMTGGVAKVSKHAIGNVLGVNDSFTDSGLTWSDPLDTNAAAVRSCVNMCHQDHVHNQPAGTTHDYNVHQDARTTASRMVTRDGSGNITAGTPNRTDFDGGAASGGQCMSCHQNPITSTRPALSVAAYTAGAHDFISNTVGTTTYDWTFTLHDGSDFDRNCTKCHLDRGDSGGGPDATTFPFGSVHFSDYPSLLAGSTNPNGTATDFICYNCHGDGTSGVDRSDKDIASQVSKTYGHPTDDDNSHDSVTEWTNAAFGNELGGVARHVSCLDCHDPHEAKAGTHTTGTNLAGPPLEGAWGAELSTYPSFWDAPTAANFTKKVIQSGVDAEATLCFKCHSSFYGTLPTSPSGGFTETDTAREFNPNNTGSGSLLGSYHPVLASAGSNRGATSNIKAPWTRTSLMTCSDCHESNSTADPNGPHGSTAGFMLKGPNTLWNASLAGILDSGMPNGTFCINCHNQNFNNSRFQGSGEKGHKYEKHVEVEDQTIYCFNCHSAIPHGTARPGILVTPRSQSINGLLVTDAAPYLQLPTGNTGLEIRSYPNNSLNSWNKSNCRCGNDGWGH